MGKKTLTTGQIVFVLLLLLAVTLLIGYQRLSDSQKRFVQNLVRQLPYLPARYAV